MTTGLALALAAVMAAGVGVADEPVAKQGDKKEGEKKEEKVEPPTPISSVTQLTATVAGAPLAYTATAGTLIVRNEKDEPYASMGYVAYAKKEPGDLARRPITFAYNAGPVASCSWLHMGVLGPRRFLTAGAGAFSPAPYSVVDTAYSIRDKSALGMIDPVGTGVSRAVGKAKDKDFWGADPDIESVSRFIKEYITQNDRWSSPKYLLGESYGTTRS